MTPVIEIKVEQFQEYLSVLRKRMSNLEPFFRDIGNLIENQSRRSFDLETAPSGNNWKPSRRKIKRGGKTLTESGALVGSLNYRYGKDFAEIGVSRTYAAIHQFGGQYSIKVPAHKRKSAWKKGAPVYVRAHTRNINMPKRAYLPENQSQIKWEQVQELFHNYMKLSEGG
jgi:phage virion morphogenesis protein